MFRKFLFAIINSLAPKLRYNSTSFSVSMIGCNLNGVCRDTPLLRNSICLVGCVYDKRF